MKEPAEIRFTPETQVELAYFSRIQVLLQENRTQAKVIEEYRRLINDLKSEERRKIMEKIKTKEHYKRQEDEIEKLMNQRRKLQAQISEMLNVKVKQLK